MGVGTAVSLSARHADDPDCHLESMSLSTQHNVRNLKAMQKPAATTDHTWSMAINETHMHMVACMRASISRKTLTHAHAHTHTHTHTRTHAHTHTQVDTNMQNNELWQTREANP